MSVIRCGGVSPQKKYSYQTQHAKSLYAQAADAAAAESNLYRFANGEGLPGLVGGAHIGVSGAAHAENADDAAHAGAQNKGDSAGCFNKQRKQCCNDKHNNGDCFELCL